MSLDNPVSVSIPFHGDTIIAIETPVGQFVAVKPICERLGLDWKSQHRKLTENPRWGMVILRIPSAGGMQETTCIPIWKFFGWLTDISVNKVKPELRERLALYQDEADAVLDRHFRQQRADLSLELAELRKVLKRCQDMLLMVMPGWAQIRHAREAGLSHDVHLALRWRFMRAWEESQEMERCGILAAGGAASPEPVTLAAQLQHMEGLLRAANLWDHAQHRPKSITDLEWALRQRFERIGPVAQGAPDLFTPKSGG